jgi:hypothetical protein
MYIVYLKTLYFLAQSAFNKLNGQLQRVQDQEVIYNNLNFDQLKQEKFQM